MGSILGLHSGRGVTNLLLLLILSVLVLNTASAQSDPIETQAVLGTGFTYQGQLKNANGLVNGSCDLQFSLWDSPSGGSQIGTTQSLTGVAVSDGNFTVQLNDTQQFGPNAFNGQARWLQIALKCGSDASFSTLSPRQIVSPAPYALALPGLRSEQNSTSPNLIGGYELNAVTAGVVGASIGGGGAELMGNTIYDNYGTIAGGLNNQAGNNNSTLSDGQGATVGGGQANQAQGLYSTVPGGFGNLAGDYSFAAGRRAKATHQGSFVWADSTDADFSSTANNQVAIRAANGVYIASNATQSAAVPVGTYFRDNAIVAWGRVNLNGGLDYGFNVNSVTRAETGVYEITLKTSLLSGPHLIPVATPEVDSPVTGAAAMRFIVIDQMAAGNIFRVFIYNGNFQLVNNDFTFIVTGR
jgi:hypothetical protein